MNNWGGKKYYCFGYSKHLIIYAKCEVWEGEEQATSLRRRQILLVIENTFIKEYPKKLGLIGS